MIGIRARTPLFAALCCAAYGVCVATPCLAAPLAPCSQVPHTDHPHLTLHDGPGRALIFLPDPENGYYRAARFDWSGVVGCYGYKEHTFFGEWFQHYEPTINDAITGPVEEFRSADGALGYDAAKPGGLFVKVGVGTLRKTADEPYKFGNAYPLVDTGHWSTHKHGHSVEFTQVLSSPTGVQYRYTKTLSLEQHGSVLTLQHQLTNLGAQPIVTDVYDHDFFMLDGQPTGPDFSLHLAFPPRLQTPLEPAASLRGNTIHYQSLLEPKQTAASYITGYDTTAADYDLRLENTSRHIGVEQTSDAPIAKMYLWSIRSTICPEAYIHLDVPPGQSRSWTIHYHFYETEEEHASIP